MYDRVVRWLLIAIVLVVGAAPVRADAPQTVALLPLATGKGFELYGQPVASEVARALRAGGLEVIVVSVGATPPARAKLVIDGSIAAGAKGAVALQVRIRDPQKGTTVATLDATAPELTALDHAAADLASRLLPAVKEQLMIQAKPPDHVEHHDDHPPPTMPPTPAVIEKPVALAWGTSVSSAFPQAAALDVAHALIAKLDHRAVDVPPATNGKPLDGDFGLSIDITKYDLVFDGVWTARATARVRWFDMRGREIADRVVHTDTLVGAKDEDQRALVRQATEQLADILAPRVIAWSRSSP